MAETHMSYLNHNTLSDLPQPVHETTFSVPEILITSVDFRPNLTREQIMRRIGEVASCLWQQAGNDNLLSCEPMSQRHTDKYTSVTFRTFRSGYDTGEFSTPHMNGWSGEESSSMYHISYDAGNGQFTTGFIHPRNFRHHVGEIEAKKRSGNYGQEMESLRCELWGDPEA